MSEVLKRALKLFLCIAITLGIFANASANSTILRITSVASTGKSETAIVEEPSITNDQIQGGIVFNTQGDYADYLFTIENTSESDYRIDGIESNNAVDALSVVFDHGEKVAAGSSSNFTLHLEYTDQLINQESLDISDLKITLHFTKIEDSGGGGEDEPEEKSDISPNTYDGIVGCVFGSSVAIIVAMFALRNMMPRKLRIVGDSVALALGAGAIGLHVVHAAIVEEIVVKFSNITLVSEYEDYVITIDTGNGPVEQTIQYGTPLSEILVRPTKTGYHFDRWTDGSGNTISEDSIVEGAIAITANMAPNQYRVAFNSNDGTAGVSSQNLTYDEAQNLSANSFTRGGYTFAGWATSADGAVIYADSENVLNLSSEDGATIELFAKWTLRTDINYIVRHSYENLMDDGYSDEDIPMQGSVDTDITPELQPRTGYVTPSQKTERINADGSSVISYNYALERVRLTLNDSEYIQTETPTDEYKYGYPISVTAKDKTGYNFLGWSNGSSIVSENQTYSFEIKSDISLTPSYEKQKFAITVDLNNGTTPTTYSNIEYGIELSTILGDEPTKTGYHFTNWTSDGNVVTGTDIVTGAMSILANYDANIYHVSFNANQGSGEMGDQEFTYDEAQNLTANSFTRAGYNFAGWATSANGEVVYANGAQVSNLTSENNATINLFAKWTFRTDINYVVRHSYENLMNDNFTDEDIPMQGSVDTDITPELRPRTGYVSPSQKTEQINADGSSIITYEYRLERKTLSLNDTEYIADGSSAAGEYKYGYPINLTAKTRESHNFLGWSNGSSIVSENQTYSFEIKNNTTLSPSYEIKKYTITIDSNNGITPSVRENVEYGTNYSELLPAQPSKTGHSFVNWTDADSNVITGESEVTTATTVTANYTANSYHVVFNANGGAGEMGDQEFTYDEAQNLAANSFARAGYDFAGWATSANGEVVYTNGAQVSNLTAENNATINLFAKWTLRTDINYLVRHSYENLADDNFTDEDIPMQGSVDTDITPELRPRTGYITPAQKTERINADGSSIIVYEYRLERKTLSLENTEYIADNSSAAGEYKYGASISVTAKDRMGYDFAGWSNGSTIVSLDSTYEFNITSSITLSPSYEIKKFTVTVDRGGAQVETHNNIEYGTALSTILGDAPTKTGYHFVSWTSDGNTVTGADIVTGAMDIIANFAANNYTITFHRNDGSDVTAEQNMVYNITSTLAQNSFARGGYTFAGWATSADGEVTYADEAQVSNLTTENDGNVDLYAKWDKLHNIHYTVIHRYQKVVGDGYADAIIDAYDGAVNEDIYPALRPQAGFQTPEQKVISDMDPNGGTSVTYIYNRLVLQLTINANDVTTSTPSGEYRYGSSISVTAAQREGYDFVNWTDVNNTQLTTQRAYSFTLTQNTTITPNYEIQKFTVTIDPSNGDASVTHQNVEWGTALSTILPSPTKTGYHFTGWTDQDDQAVTGSDVVTSAMAITGHFEANNYNVSFNANGGSGTMAAESFTYDAVAKAINANEFTRPGYTFAGWATSADGAVEYEDEESVQNLTTENNGTVTLFAKWTLRTDIPYTVYHRYENVESGFTQVEITEHGSVDTDITPPVVQEPGFNDAVADSSTPVPTQISADGSSFVIYNYYRLSKTLTINDEMYVDTATYSGSYKYGKQIELTAIERENYDFTGWTLDAGDSYVSTNKTYSFTLTDNITIAPVYTRNPFKAVYSHVGACTFDGSGSVMGTDCGEEAGYINTEIKLYDSTNYTKDYEIGFTIDAIGSEQNSQATIMNSKLESASANYPGIAARNSTNNELEITQRIAGNNIANKTTWSAPKTIKIIRYDNVVYTQIDSETPKRLQSMAGTSSYHEIPVWFGATYIPDTNSVDRLFNGTLSNMYIKRGTYDGATATISFDLNGDGITTPDSVSVLSGTPIGKLPTDPVSPTGQYFMGWYIDKDVWLNRITKDTVFTDDTTVYARWVSSSNVCEVNNEAMGTLKACVDAINNGAASSGEITILRDINPVTDGAASNDIYISAGKDIKIIGNGYRLTAHTTKPILRNENGGTLRLENVKMFTNANQGAINNKQGGHVYLDNCEIIVGNSSSSLGNLRQAIYSENSHVEITGNTIIESYSSARAAVQNKGGSVTIKSATITAHSKNAVEGTEGAVITIGDNSDSSIDRTDPIIISDTNFAVSANVGISFYDGTLIAKGSSSVQSPLASGTTISNYPAGAVQKTDKWTVDYNNTYYWLYYSLDGGS